MVSSISKNINNNYYVTTCFQVPLHVMSAKNVTNIMHPYGNTKSLDVERLPLLVVCNVSIRQREKMF